MRLRFPWHVALALIAAGGVASCDTAPFGRFVPDAQWHRRALIEGHLSHWLAVAPSETGFLRTNVTRAWQPREQKSANLVAQTRLIYALLSGYELTADPRYLGAARRGADFLLQHFRDPVYGGFFGAVAADGHVVDDSKSTYGHAFVIFALAHAYRVTKDERYRDAALGAWRAASFGLRDPGGGFRSRSPRDFGNVVELRTQNPVMHLFEAMLALFDATGDAEALAGARSIGDFVLYKLLQGRPDGSAYVAEWYSDKWQPLTRDGGGYIDLGHQFEWAFLLSAAGARGLGGIYPEVAQRVLEYAIKVGYDETDGGAFNRSFSDGSVSREKGWWQQSECLRTLMHFAALYGKLDMKRRYEQTLAFVQDEFIDAKNGGWYPQARSVCARQSCADEQLEPYHMTGMHREALELAARAKADR
jgi:mannose/cellobiose epimerase-like protein (N-acyl-D-glucosamine 2-epimerase family)